MPPPVVCSAVSHKPDDPDGIGIYVYLEKHVHNVDTSYLMIFHASIIVSQLSIIERSSIFRDQYTLLRVIIKL